MEQPSKKTPGDLRRMTAKLKTEYLKLPSTRSHFGLVEWKPFAPKVEGMSKDKAIEVDMAIISIQKKNKGW